jgi:cyclopropane fatty-acyl-phospholipid synthase-like methyltransferase
MNRDIERWFRGAGAVLLKKVGIRPGDLVLDFGCGSGCYTIPAAEVVGNRGIVYALEKNRNRLTELTREASTMGLGNILPVHSLTELKQILGGRLLQGVLLYDVIHSYYFSYQERTDLLRSLAPLVSEEGLLSIFPRHMSKMEVEGTGNCLESLGFTLEAELESQLLHDEHFSSGKIYTFRKAAAS